MGGMGFLKNIRSKSRLPATSHTDQHAHADTHAHAHPHPHHSGETKTSARTPNPTAKYPNALLEQIFTFVCAHAGDETYTSCEESMNDGGCMLCDMRDLSHCVLVNRQWSAASQNVL